MVRVFLSLFLLMFSAASFADDELTSLVKSATGNDPQEVQYYEITGHISVVFLTTSMYPKGHLQHAKQTMPALLDAYPDAETFFFGWRHENNPSQYYMKLNFSRDDVGDLDWGRLSTDQVPSIAREYWTIPALR